MEYLLNYKYSLFGGRRFCGLSTSFWQSWILVICVLQDNNLLGQQVYVFKNVHTVPYASLWCYEPWVLVMMGSTPIDRLGTSSSGSHPTCDFEIFLCKRTSMFLGDKGLGSSMKGSLEAQNSQISSAQSLTFLSSSTQASALPKDLYVVIVPELSSDRLQVCQLELGSPAPTYTNPSVILVQELEMWSQSKPSSQPSWTGDSRFDRRTPASLYRTGSIWPPHLCTHMHIQTGTHTTRTYTYEKSRYLYLVHDLLSLYLGFSHVFPLVRKWLIEGHHRNSLTVSWTEIGRR